MVPTVKPSQKLTLFSIMPLDADRIDEVCADIRRQQTEGVSTCALFEMTLVPEGDPPVDKVGYFCGIYRQYRAKLDAMGLKSGVLVQASLGHGWKLGEMFPFQQNIGFTDGVPINAAERLTDRGFGQYLGVAVRPWQGKQPTGEYLLHDGNQTPAQFELRELVPDPKAETLSVTVSAPGIGTPEALFPGSVRFRNELGGTVVTFCGTPATGYIIVDAFSFLNETRKRQLTELMREMGELPTYYPGDAEVYCKAADLPDGGIFFALFDLSYDPLEQIPICCERELTRVERLTAEGAFVPLAFERNSNVYLLQTRAEPLTPVILRLY
ncbi:MAG: hypothetical protein IJK40_00470 [Clostridia bacterium]|nr:hypothetical protein [Clostridia bacterium]